MRTNAIVRIILFSLAILVLLGILAVGLGIGTFMFNTDSGIDTGSHISIETVASVGSVNASEIRELEIEWAAGSITIKPSADTDQITFSETEQSQDKYRMVWTRAGDKLSIKFCETQVFFGVSFDQAKDLVITVPQDWVCQELSLDVASADLEVTNLTINEVDFDGASGICTFENCNVVDMEMDTASGDVEFTGTLSTFAFDGMSANCHVAVTNVPSRIDMSSMSGDLDLTLPEDCGFTVSMDAMSSEFHSDFETTTSNGHHVHGNGSCSINVDAMSGDVTIRKGTNHH